MEKNDIEDSVRVGVQAAIADPKTWEAGLIALRTSLREAAEEESGKWVVGWITWLLKKAALGVAIIAVLYYTGGLPAVLGWLKVKS